MNETKYSKKELDRISHSLGIDLFKSVISDTKKDKTLPIEFYRNRYQVESDETLDGLVSNGYAFKKEYSDLNFYHITEEGISKFRKEFKVLANYQPKAKRDIGYLKHKINWYCDFYNYRFCDDNSNHILKEYEEKFSKGFYVSHTTKDCIVKFKKELKQHFKKQ